MAATNARERILDAAAAVMAERGLAAATTKQIAAAAGYSEATLYKNFDDKQQIFLDVLTERMPAFRNPESLVGTSTVRANLEAIVTQLLRFYVRTFPMAASIFATPQLLAVHREGIAGKGHGPIGPVLSVQRYLDGEVAAARLGARDTVALSRLLAGAAFQQAFLACYSARDEVPDAEDVARGLVAAVLPIEA
jgi:AcrR family transcriptional regulator